MNTSQLQLFLRPDVLGHLPSALLRRLFQRFAPLLGPNSWFLRQVDPAIFVEVLPGQLAAQDLPQPLAEALREIEHLAATEDWPESDYWDRQDPEHYPDAHRLYRAIRRWFEQHPSQPTPDRGCVRQDHPQQPPSETAPVNGSGKPDSPASELDALCPSGPAADGADAHIRAPEQIENASPPLNDSDDPDILRLARLSPAEYDRCRAAEAKRLKLRLRTLDAQVARVRRTLADTDAAGQPLVMTPLEPWPEPVDGAQVVTEVSQCFSRHIVLWKGAADAIALWVVHAHCYRAFFQTPRLNLFSPEHGCGKSTTMDVIHELVPRPFRADNVRSPVVYRVVHKYNPVLELDELDSYLPESNQLRGLLNAGYRHGGMAFRCAGDRFDVNGYKACAPTVVAGIGFLPPTLHDRSIFIPMLKAGEGDKYERFDPRKVDHLHELASKLARWTKDNFDTLKNCDPVLPPAASNRVGDNWRPLFAVAQVLGGEWPQRILDAFHSLRAGADEMLARHRANGNGTATAVGANGSSTALLALEPVQLLSDVRRVFEEAGETCLFVRTVVEALYSMPGRKYHELAGGRQGSGVTDIWLGRQLSRLGVYSSLARLEGRRAKAYALQDVVAACERLRGEPPAWDYEI